MLLSAVSVSGCADNVNTVASAETVSPTLQIFNWNNYIAPETIQNFEALCQCQVKQDYFSDNVKKAEEQEGNRKRNFRRIFWNFRRNYRNEEYKQQQCCSK